MLTSTQATSRTCIQNHTGGIRQGYGVRARLAPTHARTAPRAPRPVSDPRGFRRMIIGPSEEREPPREPSDEGAASGGSRAAEKARKKRKAERKAAKKAAKEVAAAATREATAEEPSFPGALPTEASAVEPSPDEASPVEATLDEAAPASPTPASPTPAEVDDARAVPTDGTPHPTTAPRPTGSRPQDAAGAGLAGRIGALRGRVDDLIAIADALPPAVPGDRSPSVPASRDPLTQPVEPIPAAIAAALVDRAVPAPGHDPTPGVASPPGTADGRAPDRVLHTDDERAALRVGGSAGGRAAHRADPPAPSAVLVARELLAGGMAPDGVAVRLRDGYGVADPAAALALAAG